MFWLGSGFEIVGRVCLRFKAVFSLQAAGIERLQERGQPVLAQPWEQQRAEPQDHAAARMWKCLESDILA